MRSTTSVDWRFRTSELNMVWLWKLHSSPAWRARLSYHQTHAPQQPLCYCCCYYCGRRTFSLWQRDTHQSLRMVQVIHTAENRLSGSVDNEAPQKIFQGRQSRSRLLCGSKKIRLNVFGLRFGLCLLTSKIKGENSNRKQQVVFISFIMIVQRTVRTFDYIWGAFLISYA